MSHTYARRIAFAALALPVLLTGCTHAEPVPKMPEAAGSTPTPSAPSAPSASETSEPTGPIAPIAPTLPPEAQGKGVKAAEAFVRHYYETVNYAQATGDTHYLRSLGSPGCSACTGGVDTIDRVVNQGGTIEGGAYTVTDATVSSRRDFPGAALYYVTVQVVSADQRVTGTKGLDGHYGGGRTKLRFGVLASDGGLQVASWITQ